MSHLSDKGEQGEWTVCCPFSWAVPVFAGLFSTCVPLAGHDYSCLLPNEIRSVPHSLHNRVPDEC